MDERPYMGEPWVTADGKIVTDEMVERWERELETGEFFDKGVTVGGVIYGLPFSATGDAKTCAHDGG